MRPSSRIHAGLSLITVMVIFLLLLAACLMISAWMLCASVGLVLARYYRPAWPNTQPCKKPVWFQVRLTHSNVTHSTRLRSGN